MPARGAETRRPQQLVIVALLLTLATLVPLGVGTASASPVVAAAASCPSPSAIATWPIERLAAATVVDPVDAGSVGSLAPEVSSGIGGILLTGDDANGRLAGSIAALLGKSAPGDPPIVMVDEEGGSVQRLVPLVGRVPSARSMAATMSASAIELLAKGLGAKLRALGVTMDLAPVLDLDGGAGPDNTDADGTRSFSPVEAVAARDGIAFAKGLLEANVLPVQKHFPGLGGASGNTDLEPTSTKPYLGLDTPGVEPFEAGIRAGLPAVMVANASVPNLSAEPASVSPAVIDGLLRSKMGFGGLVLTDSLSVPSVTSAGFDLANAALAAIRAGADEVLFNAYPDQVATDSASIEQALVAAVGSHRLARSRLVEAADHAMAARTLVRAC